MAAFHLWHCCITWYPWQLLYFPSTGLFAPVKIPQSSGAVRTQRWQRRNETGLSFSLLEEQRRMRRRKIRGRLHEKAGADEEHRDGVRLVEPRCPRVVLLGGAAIGRRRRPPLLAVPRPRLGLHDTSSVRHPNQEGTAALWV